MVEDRFGSDIMQTLLTGNADNPITFGHHIGPSYSYVARLDFVGARNFNDLKATEDVDLL